MEINYMVPMIAHLRYVKNAIGGLLPSFALYR